MKKETLLIMAMALVLTGCKDAKSNGDAADSKQAEVKQEQDVKDDGCLAGAENGHNTKGGVAACREHEAYVLVVLG